MRIGTRGSRLALWQANYVAERLRPLVGGRAVELVEIQTTGDNILDAPLAQIGGEGVFTRAIQLALLAGQVDVAVHSLKDLPTTVVDGLTLAAVPPRGPVGDVFVSKRYSRFEALPLDATLATSSLRRRAQVLHHRPDLRLVDIRGNVETRLRKLVEQKLDGLVLAQAGLERLGLSGEITEVLDSAWMLPAVGQGALGLECRAEDHETLAVLAHLDDEPTRRAVLAERAFLRALGGGCQVPIGALSSHNATEQRLRGVVLSPDGRQRIEGYAVGHGEKAGIELAQQLLAQGAALLLQKTP